MIDPLEIQAYADGELSPADEARVEKEIAASEEATRQLVRIRELKSVLQTKVEPVDAPDVWSACVSRLDEIDRTRRVEGFVGRYAWGLCGLFLMVIIAGGLLNRMNGSSVRTGDVVGFVSSGLGPTSRGIISPDVQRTERALDQLLGAYQSADRIQLVSRQEGQTPDGRHVIVLYNLRDSKGPMKLAMVEGLDQFDDAQQLEPGSFGRSMVGSRSVVFWVDNNVGLILQGERPADELQAIAERIRITGSR